MNGATHLLATDLDGTLVGDKEGLQQLLDFYEEQPYDVSLVYITGRYFQSALSLIENENLPIPDVLVTDVGTEIRIGDDFAKDTEWTLQMKENWKPEQIEEIAAQIAGLNKQQVPVKNRCSYYVDNERPVIEFRKKLQESAIPHKFIFSGGRDVDIIPAQSGKGQALEYILDKFEVREANLLVAGDSGNDLEMLTLGFPSVIVGNAHPELLECPEDPMIFRSSQKCAGGIHEAWNHFHSN